MRNWTALLILLCFFSKTWGQTALLGDYDLEAGDYSLLVFLIDLHEDGFGSAGYFDSKPSLLKIQSEMVYETPAAVYPYSCQEGLDIVLCEKGKAVEWNRTSPNCHSISGPKGSFEYHGELDFSKSKQARHERIEFSNLAAARKALDSLRGDTNLLLAIEPAWVTFEGEFDLFLDNASGSIENEELLLRKRIAEEWGNEAYELEFDTRGAPKSFGHTYKAHFTCNKSLYDRIDAYKKSQLGWEAFPLQLDCFWRE